MERCTRVDSRPGFSLVSNIAITSALSERREENPLRLLMKTLSPLTLMVAMRILRPTRVADSAIQKARIEMLQCKREKKKEGASENEVY